MDLWNRMLDKEGWSEDDEEAQNEAEKRRQDPDAYDCAVAICDFDEPSFLSERLADARVKPDARAPQTGQPLLFLAIVKDRMQSCRLLVEAGADLTALVDGRSYLVTAISSDSSRPILQLLLDSGLAVPAGPVGRHPSMVHFALWSASEELALELVQRRADVDVFQHFLDVLTLSLFEAAVRRRYYDLAAAILQRRPPRTLAHLRSDDNALASLQELDPEELDPFYASARNPDSPPFSKDRLLQLCGVVESLLGE